MRLRRILLMAAATVLAALGSLAPVTAAQAAPVAFNGVCEAPIFGQTAELCLYGHGPNGLTDYQANDTNHFDDPVIEAGHAACCGGNHVERVENTALTFCRNGLCYPTAFVCNGTFYQGPCFSVAPGARFDVTGIYYRADQSHYFSF